MRTLVLLAILIVCLAQISGCHYYLNAVPRVIISSEPIQFEENQPNNIEGR
jgi:hypothetical protein